MLLLKAYELHFEYEENRREQLAVPYLMENPQQEAIGHFQGRSRKAFARLDFQTLLTPFHNHVGQAQLLWGYHLKITGGGSKIT